MSRTSIVAKILNKLSEQINPATEELQQTQIDNQELIIAAIGNISVGGGKAIDTYSYQAKSVTSTYKYFFFEDSTGNWAIKRKTLSTGVFDYAKGAGGYDSVYDTPTTDPTGSITWGSYGEIF